MADPESGKAMSHKKRPSLLTSILYAIAAIAVSVSVGLVTDWGSALLVFLFALALAVVIAAIAFPDLYGDSVTDRKDWRVPTLVGSQIIAFELVALVTQLTNEGAVNIEYYTGAVQVLPILFLTVVIQERASFLSASVPILQLAAGLTTIYLFMAGIVSFRALAVNSGTGGDARIVNGAIVAAVVGLVGSTLFPLRTSASDREIPAAGSSRTSVGDE
jgi:hypothetical protein